VVDKVVGFIFESTSTRPIVHAPKSFGDDSAMPLAVALSLISARILQFLQTIEIIRSTKEDSMEFSAFSRPPKNPCSAGLFSPHNFSISLRGLYIGLIY
jgi:hypothetical protein